MHNLEHIRTRPLSHDEQSRVWNNIEQRLATTPAQSPFVFPLRKALSLAFAFVVIVGVVDVSHSALPGDTLFPIKRSVERVESTLNPSARAGHAQERLREFIAITQSDETSIAMKESTADMTRTASAPAQESADMLTFSAMSGSSVSDDATASATLSEHIEQAIETTRTELESLLSEALMRGDQDTISEILTTTEIFEAHVASLRASQ